MADYGIRPFFFAATPGTSLSTAFTVPNGKEYTLRFARGTNKTAADATFTVTVGGSNIAFNAPARIAGSVNVIGPDFIILPAGTVVQHRASATAAVDMVYSGTERDL